MTNSEKMKVRKVKEGVIVATAVVGLVAVCVAFWKLVTAFLWACYYAGVPM